jgi:type II secretory pathway predicted ATPase ExeA
MEEVSAVNPMARADRDPFSSTADPAAYIPRTATEAVLVRLEMELRDGALVVCLSGPAGSGKTLLLRVLEERLLGDFQPLHVPYPKLDPDEFCQWGLAALGEPRAEDPELALAARIARDAEAKYPPLVWMVDDADSLPIATLRCLRRLQANEADALRIVLARSREFPLHELSRGGLPIAEVELEGEMGTAEMAHYVRARLDRFGTDPEVRAQLETALDQLYESSGGNPGRLHAAAAALLCFGPEEIRSVIVEERSAQPSRVEIEEMLEPEPVVEPEPDPPEPVPAPARKRHRLRRLGRR